MSGDNIIYITPIDSPFQNELIERTQQYCQSEIYTFYAHELSGARKHWGSCNSIGRTLRFFKSIDVIYLCFKYKPRLIVFNEYRSFYGLIIVLLSFVLGFNYIIGPCEILQKRNLFIDLLKRKYFTLISYFSKSILSVGETARKDYSLLTRSSVYNIPYSFDLNVLNQYNLQKAETNVRVFLISGRLEPFRNPLKSIIVFEKLMNRFPSYDLRLVISGKGSLFDDCLGLINRLGISDKVTWKNDFDSWYDIHGIYNGVDYLLSLQDYSGWGLIVQEALAAGVFVIGSDQMMAVKDLIINGKNGLLVDVHDDLEFIVDFIVLGIGITMDYCRSDVKKTVEKLDVESVSFDLASVFNK